jgi:hypothetical protein
MATVSDYAKLADAVYDDDPSVAGWTRESFRSSGSGLYNAFQGAVFKNGPDVVFTFKGTSQKRDVVADAKLAAGMNTEQYSDACDYFDKYVMTKGNKVSACGHSLGGAIAQIVGNRKNIPFVTFNAPGVGLFAKPNSDSTIGKIGEGLGLIVNPGTYLRVGGAVLSSVRHPQQALQDFKAVTTFVRGVNFRVGKDVVGSYGVHFGKVIELPYSGAALDVLEKHKMKTVKQMLEASNYKDYQLDTLID